jgi:cytochrome c-type biogenesis protein CcmF
MVATWVVLIRWRLPMLRSEHRLESMVSRESSFLFNNLVLLVACFAVLWGTVFPVLSEAVRGEKIVVGAPFFNKVNIPLGLFLLALTGIGPLIAWRRSSWRSLQKAFLLPAVIGVAVAAVTFAAGTRDLYAVITFGLSGFVTATLVIDFYRGARVRARSLGTHLPGGLLDLINRNHRRYGGYIVHFGIVLLFVGFAGRAFETDIRKPIEVGQSLEVKGYTFQCEDLVEDDDSNPNYLASRMTLTLKRGDRTLATLMPERRFYLASEQPTTEVARYSSWREDVYTVFTKVASDAPAELQVFINPLVRWVWVGSIVFAIGTLLTLLPDRRRRPSGAAPQAAARVEQERTHA